MVYLFFTHWTFWHVLTPKNLRELLDGSASRTYQLSCQRVISKVITSAPETWFPRLRSKPLKVLAIICFPAFGAGVEVSDNRVEEDPLVFVYTYCLVMVSLFQSTSWTDKSLFMRLSLSSEPKVSQRRLSQRSRLIEQRTSILFRGSLFLSHSGIVSPQGQ